MNWRNDKNKIF